jgi:3-isopropylmalate dehydrogenase
MLLEWQSRRTADEALGAAAAHIERAVERVLSNPATRTRDIGGTLGTTEFSADIVIQLRGEFAAHD